MNNKWQWRLGEKRKLLHCWQKYKSVQPPWKTVWKFCKKLKIELPYDPAIQFMSIYPKELKWLSLRVTCTLNTALFAIAKTQKQSKWPFQGEP